MTPEMWLILQLTTMKQLSKILTPFLISFKSKAFLDKFNSLVFQFSSWIQKLKLLYNRRVIRKSKIRLFETKNIFSGRNLHSNCLPKNRSFSLHIFQQKLQRFSDWKWQTKHENRFKHQSYMGQLPWNYWRIMSF